VGKDNVLKRKTEHTCMHQFSESEDRVYAVSSKTHTVADQLVLGAL